MADSAASASAAPQLNEGAEETVSSTVMECSINFDTRPAKRGISPPVICTDVSKSQDLFLILLPSEKHVPRFPWRTP